MKKHPTKVVPLLSEVLSLIVSTYLEEHPTSAAVLHIVQSAVVLTTTPYRRRAQYITQRTAVDGSELLLDVGFADVF